MLSAEVRSVALIVIVGIGAAASGPSFGQSMNAPGTACEKAASTADTAGCFDKAYKAADRDLNALYARVQRAVEGDELVALKQAERLWVQYRDATCNAERSLYQGGTAASVTHLACLEAETRLRHTSLVRSYGWRLEKLGL